MRVSIVLCDQNIREGKATPSFRKDHCHRVNSWDLNSWDLLAEPPLALQPGLDTCLSMGFEL